MAEKKIQNYQELNAELERILDSLQTSDVDIDDAVKSYERGMQIVEELEAYLKTAENKVTKIKKQFES